MVVLILFIGATASLGTHSWLPIVGALVIATLIQEAMMYDLHRHVLHLEDHIDG